MSDKPFTIVGLGEVLWDVTPSGKTVGGAPANFAYVSTQLGNAGLIASRVGRDPDGFELFQELDEKGIDTTFIERDEQFPTGRVEVTLVEGIPEYEIEENAAWDNLELTSDWLDLASRCDSVCFGSLAQRSDRSRETIVAVLTATRPDCLRIFDVNLRQNYYSPPLLEASLQIATVLKLNEEELAILSEMFGCESNDKTTHLELLRRKFDIQTACVTLGDDGSILMREGEASVNHGIPTNVVDTIGAGDAFTAAMVKGLLDGLPLDEINERANRVGAYVASQKGAMPVFPADPSWLTVS